MIACWSFFFHIRCWAERAASVEHKRVSIFNTPTPRVRHTQRENVKRAERNNVCRMIFIFFDACGI